MSDFSENPKYWSRYEENEPREKCNHTNRDLKQGLLEDYEKCKDCGLEIPLHFPKQWNF